eukprot:5537131-Pyramimonas_sp.AAC.1
MLGLRLPPRRGRRSAVRTVLLQSDQQGEVRQRDELGRRRQGARRQDSLALDAEAGMELRAKAAALASAPDRRRELGSSGSRRWWVKLTRARD